VTGDGRAPVLAPGLLGPALEVAHASGVRAAACGLRDAGLGALRLTGPGVGVLADAAVSSATPFLRSPLLARISAVAHLHPAAGDATGACPTCGGSAPCSTSRALRW
jgi:hypothetical protein